MICFTFLIKAYLPNGTEMQNLNVFRCYTCKAQNPRYFVEDFAEQITYVLPSHPFRSSFGNCSRAEQECQTIERNIQDAKEQLTNRQKHVNEHQQTVNNLEATINEIKVKCGRLGKVNRKKNTIDEVVQSILLIYSKKGTS